MNTKQLADLALGQLDNLGYALRRFGITERVNRHDIIAYAMTRQTHIKGELSRLELRLELQKIRLEKLRVEAGQVADRVIGYLPDVVSEPAQRLSRKVFAA